MTRRKSLLAKACDQFHTDLLQLRVVLFLRRELIPNLPDLSAFLARRFADETFSGGFHQFPSACYAQRFDCQGADANGMHLALDCRARGTNETARLSFISVALRFYFLQPPLWN
ncbi:hypothetical protein [Caballeronia sp. GAFFF1]|uniref:hypothetical protein n=1 Tax=Caballeronia sp. GAFFF1 TaxID=2921779 RepID=UPI0020277515|nr:hypothetical protein [Caballeronia sp. GAFFF1]